MRDIFEQKKMNWNIQQGCIINCCVSEDYEKKDVWGIIITPRCDIENKKVSTIHYLPIVEFKDWLESDFINIFKHKIRQDIKSNLMQYFTTYSISTSLLENNISKEDVFRVVNEKVTDKKKVLTQIVKLLDDYFDIKDASKISKLIKNKLKIKTQILNDLKDSKNKDFLLLEDWNEKGNYKVVLLRDVRRITFNFSQKISNSIFESDVSEEEWLKNDIKQTKNKDSIIYIESKLKSPYIEYLLQLFFHNFGRIGVENMHSETLDQLDLLTIKKFKL